MKSTLIKSTVYHQVRDEYVEKNLGLVSYQVGHAGGGLSAGVALHAARNGEDAQNPVHQPPPVPRPFQQEHRRRVNRHTDHGHPAPGQQNHPGDVHVVEGLAGLGHVVDQGQVQQDSPADDQREARDGNHQQVRQAAALQHVDAPPAPDAVHVLHGRAEQLLEQDPQGQQAEGRPSPETPLAGDAGGGGQEADAAQPAAQDQEHRHAVAQQGLPRVSEPPQLHLLLQDVVLNSKRVRWAIQAQLRATRAPRRGEIVLVRHPKGSPRPSG